MVTPIKKLTPMAFASGIARSIAFYEHFGFAVGDTFTPSNADNPSWVWLSSGNAELMIAKATEPIVPGQQGILFYLYVEDIAETCAALLGAGLQSGPITTPFYAPQGEFRLADPDGYTLT